MKLHYITNVRLPTERAHGLQIMKMCEAFVQSGVELELIAPRRFNIHKENSFSYYKVRESFNIKKIPCLDTQPLIKDWMPLFLKAILSWIQWLSFVFFSLFYAKKDIPIYTRDEMVVFFHSLLGRKVFYEVHTLPKRGNYFYRLVFRFSKAIIPITRHMKKSIEKEFTINPNKIFWAADAISLEDFEILTSKKEARKALGLPLNKKLVFYIGALEGWKGHDTLLEASKHLPDSIKVVIIGGSFEKVERLKLKYPQVLFLGFKDFHELPRNQKAADILVIPNSGKEKISKYYTSPLKLFSSMASGRAIIVSDLPSLREIVSEKEVLFFKADNVKDLTKKILFLSKSNSLREKLINSSTERVKEFTWEKRARELIKNLKL